jgi:hypothetical protein
MERGIMKNGKNMDKKKTKMIDKNNAKKIKQIRAFNVIFPSNFRKINESFVSVISFKRN